MNKFYYLFIIVFMILIKSVEAQIYLKPDCLYDSVLIKNDTMIVYNRLSEFVTDYDVYVNCEKKESYYTNEFLDRHKYVDYYGNGFISYSLCNYWDSLFQNLYYDKYGLLSSMVSQYSEEKDEDLLFYENGRLQKIQNYKNRNLDGLYIDFYDNGEINNIGRFENHYKIGEWKEFYSNSVLKSVGFYNGMFLELRYNRATEEFEFFNENADTIAIESIPKDIYKILVNENYYYYKDGIWEFYSESGDLLKKEFYKEGQLLRTKTYKKKK